MATSKAILSNYEQKNKTHQIYIRVTKGNIQKPFDTTYSVLACQWDEQAGLVKDHPEKKKINATIKQMIADVQAYATRCELNGKPFRFSDIFKKEMEKNDSFIDWLRGEAKAAEDRKSTSVKNEYNKIAKLLSGWKPALTFNDLHEDGILIQLEKYMRETAKNNPNTRRSRFALMRQSYGRAIDKGYAPVPNPFKGYKIKGEKNKKEKLTFAEVEMLKNYKTSRRNRQLAKDMWLLSYYVRGIRFENVISIRKDDIKNGQVEFQMVKSKKAGYEKIHPELKKIINRWINTPGDYLFPIIKKEMPSTSDEFLKLKSSKGTHINETLSVIMKHLGIKKHITFHCARHTFAYHLLLNKTPIAAIQQALGHSSIATTQRYLDELENTTVDNATLSMYQRTTHTTTLLAV